MANGCTVVHKTHSSPCSASWRTAASQRQLGKIRKLEVSCRVGLSSEHCRTITQSAASKGEAPSTLGRQHKTLLPSTADPAVSLTGQLFILSVIPRKSACLSQPAISVPSRYSKHLILLIKAFPAKILEELMLSNRETGPKEQKEKASYFLLLSSVKGIP